MTQEVTKHYHTNTNTSIHRTRQRVRERKFGTGLKRSSHKWTVWLAKWNLTTWKCQYGQCAMCIMLNFSRLMPASKWACYNVHWQQYALRKLPVHRYAYACMREFGYIFVIRQLNETKSLMHMHMQKRSTKAFYVHAMHSNFVSLMNANIIENIIPIMSSMPSSWSCRLRSQNRNQSRLES